MEESGPHKQSILRNKEVSLKNAPRKPRDVTRPTVMVKRLGFRGTLPVKYKIDFWNNPITASILVWNQVVFNQSQQLGYLNSKLMLSWDCHFNIYANKTLFGQHFEIDHSMRSLIGRRFPVGPPVGFPVVLEKDFHYRRGVLPLSVGMLLPGTSRPLLKTAFLLLINCFSAKMLKLGKEKKNCSLICPAKNANKNSYPKSYINRLQIRKTQLLHERNSIDYMIIALHQRVMWLLDRRLCISNFESWYRLKILSCVDDREGVIVFCSVLLYSWEWLGKWGGVYPS